MAPTFHLPLKYEVRSFKAYIKSYIPLETAAKLDLKQGISSENVHLHGLTRPVKSANRELQNEKFMPTVGFEPGTFRIRCERVKP